MKALKALVIGMGVLIVAGMALLVYGLIQNGGKLMKNADAPAQTVQTPQPPLDALQPSPPAKPASPYSAKISLEEGEDIDLIGLAGKNLLVRIYYQGRNDRIVVIDPATGENIGSIYFSYEADAKR